jgi:hypothetical protein
MKGVAQKAWKFTTDVMPRRWLPHRIWNKAGPRAYFVINYYTIEIPPPTS